MSSIVLHHTDMVHAFISCVFSDFVIIRSTKALCRQNLRNPNELCLYGVHDYYWFIKGCMLNHWFHTLLQLLLPCWLWELWIKVATDKRWNKQLVCYQTACVYQHCWGTRDNVFFVMHQFHTSFTSSPNNLYYDYLATSTVSMPNSEGIN